MAARRDPEAELLAARLGAQRLSGPPVPDAVAAVRHLLAVQAQDPRGARLALRVRSRAPHAAAVDAALTLERSLVITWVNRGTLHLIAAEDEPLLHLLTTPQLRSANQRRLSQEGVSPAAAQRGSQLIVRALSADGPMTRGQIRQLLQRADIPVAGQALVHILLHATLEGHIVRGPMVGSEHAFVLARDWLGERPRLDRDQALAELARRYLAGHAPADERDLAKWAGLALRDTRAGLQAIAGELRTFDAHGRVALRRQPQTPHPLAPPRLLGPFDPLLLGWASRHFVLGDAQDVVTVNGIFRAVILVAGRAIGTWTAPGGQVELACWAPPSARVLAALQREATAVQRYLAPEADD